MKKTMILLVSLAFLLFAGCRDSAIAQLKAIGSDGVITCYSGGRVIYEGESSGKISTTHQSDGWEFMDKNTKRLVRVSGDCVIKN